jgi:glycosyltransferase involved in cell wall biosynthesis
MKIGIQTKGFDRWGGGLDFIYYISSCLDYANEKEKHDISLFIAKNNFLFWLEKNLHPYRKILHSLRHRKSLTWEPWQGFDQIYLEDFFMNLQSIKKISPGYSLKSHLAYVQAKEIDIIFPCITPLPKDFTWPWVGYIYDFQHKYLSHLFDDKTIAYRDKQFLRMLNRAKHVIVNAHAVKHDTETFIGSYGAKIHVLPFSPSPRLEWLLEDRNLSRKYNIDKPYFIVCNQFWKHKNHNVVFDAFSKLISSEGREFQLVCTGSVGDHRDSAYFPSLREKLNKLDLENDVRILGHIPKSDQIALLKRSISVIQATLFEGGPGGGASYDAISLGQPLIISDIPVNREISDQGIVSFFDPLSSDDLVMSMLKAVRNPYVRVDNKILWEKGCHRKQNLAKTIFTIIEEAVTGH